MMAMKSELKMKCDDCKVDIFAYNYHSVIVHDKVVCDACWERIKKEREKFGVLVDSCKDRCDECENLECLRKWAQRTHDEGMEKLALISVVNQFLDAPRIHVPLEKAFESFRKSVKPFLPNQPDPNVPCIHDWMLLEDVGKSSIATMYCRKCGKMSTNQVT
jgi:hypothetical protein